MSNTTTERVLPRRRSTTGVARLIRRLERERRDWARPQDREISRSLALEDSIDIAGGEPILIYEIRPVRDQAAPRHHKA